MIQVVHSQLIGKSWKNLLGKTPLKQQNRSFKACGHILESSLYAMFRTPVAIGVFLGLLLGKPMGIVAACVAVVYLGAAHLPAGVRWKHLFGAGFLGRIGFTTSIFLANLAFVENALFDHSKIGILSASMIAAILGWVLLKISTKEEEHQTSTE